jgi:hypothetical protein
MAYEEPSSQLFSTMMTDEVNSMTLWRHPVPITFAVIQSSEHEEPLYSWPLQARRGSMSSDGYSVERSLHTFEVTQIQRTNRLTGHSVPRTCKSIRWHRLGNSAWSESIDHRQRDDPNCYRASNHKEDQDAGRYDYWKLDCCYMGILCVHRIVTSCLGGRLPGFSPSRTSCLPSC